MEVLGLQGHRGFEKLDWKIRCQQEKALVLSPTQVSLFKVTEGEPYWISKADTLLLISLATSRKTGGGLGIDSKLFDKDGLCSRISSRSLGSPNKMTDTINDNV